jgi:hypothetical protein
MKTEDGKNIIKTFVFLASLIGKYKKIAYLKNRDKIKI